MDLSLKFAAIGIALCVASCTPPRAKLQEIQLPPERIVQNGYSLVPPDEKGWFVAGRDQYRSALVKTGEGQDETYAIQSTLVRLPTFTTTEDLVRFVKEGQAKDTNPERFKVLLHDTVLQQQKGVDCVKSHFLVEDVAAVKRTARTGGMLLEAMSLTCPHPKNKTVGVNVTYSHRCYPEQKDPAFDGKAKHILDSVEFAIP